MHRQSIALTCTGAYNPLMFMKVKDAIPICKQRGRLCMLQYGFYNVHHLCSLHMGQFPGAKIAPQLKCYKNASRLNRYNFQTDNAIDFLFSTHHSEMVQYEVLKIGSR